MTIQQKLHLPMRTSTAVLILLFVGLLVLYFWVRPDTAATSNTGQDSPQTGQQATNPPGLAPPLRRRRADLAVADGHAVHAQPAAAPVQPGAHARRPSTPGSTPLPTSTPTPTASTPVAAPSG